MVFKRRNKRTALKKFREFFLPEKGWRRALEYLSHRIRRLPDTPHRIALGLGCGVLASFTPFFGLHFLVGALLAYIVRANIIAAILGTFFGNPITFPFMGAISIRIGEVILGKVSDPGGTIINNSLIRETNLTSFGILKDFLLEVYSENFIPYALGGLICGLLMAFIIYFLSKPLIFTYQRRKRRRNEK